MWFQYECDDCGKRQVSIPYKRAPAERIVCQSCQKKNLDSTIAAMRYSMSKA